MHVGGPYLIEVCLHSVGKGECSSHCSRLNMVFMLMCECSVRIVPITFNVYRCNMGVLTECGCVHKIWECFWCVCVCVCVCPQLILYFPTECEHVYLEYGYVLICVSTLDFELCPSMWACLP